LFNLSSFESCVETRNIPVIGRKKNFFWDVISSLLSVQKLLIKCIKFRFSHFVYFIQKILTKCQSLHFRNDIVLESGVKLKL
jgi:hypothetical protein